MAEVEETPKKKSHSSPTGFSFRQSIGFGLFTLVICALAIEGGTRLVFIPKPLEEFRAFVNPEWDSGVIFQRDPELFWKFCPSQTLYVRSVVSGTYEITINNQGFRGEDWPRPTPIKPSLKILFLGDSCVFGWGARPGNTFPEQTAQILQDQLDLSAPIDVMPAGTPGYSSHQALILLNRWGPEYQPDWVITFLGTNDALPCVGADDLAQSEMASIRTWRGLLEVSYFWKYLRETLEKYERGKFSLTTLQKKARSNLWEGPRRVPLDQFEKNLHEIHRVSEALSAKSLFLTRQNATPDHWLSHYNDMIRKVARQEGLPLVEVADGFLDYASTEVYYDIDHDPVHPNDLGYRLIAEWAAEKLIEGVSRQDPD